MKYYILINPFTNKPIQFSTFKDEDFDVANIPTNMTVGLVVETSKAICVEVEYDPSLLEKTFDPVTKTFI